MARIVRCKHFKVVSISFLSGLSYGDNSKESTGKERTIFILPYHDHPLSNFQTFICSFASETITFLFSIVSNLTTIFWLNNITPFLEFDSMLISFYFFILIWCLQLPENKRCFGIRIDSRHVFTTNEIINQ